MRRRKTLRDSFLSLLRRRKMYFGLAVLLTILLLIIIGYCIGPDRIWRKTDGTAHEQEPGK
jgi:hypothetical protein